MSQQATKAEADVSTPSGAYQRMTPRWALIEVLLGGTEALRAAGQTYLPKHENESQVNYDNRLTRATLLNAVEDTLDTLVGRPFAENMILNEDIPAEVKSMLDNVDLQGTALQPFCRNWFYEGWAKGFSHVYVDFPIGEETVDGDGAPRVRTLDDDRREGLRPYLVQIRPENVIAAYAEVIDGHERLTHVRFYEVTIERNGYEEVCVQRIRVLEPGYWELWLFDPQKKKWNLEKNGFTEQTEIPFETFYAGKRAGLHEAKPPLTDLAHLNIEHFQSSSDQRNVLTVARFPILAASGVPPEQKVVVGPNNFLATEAADGKWYYVEHTGAAIAAGASSLEDLENKMAAYGSEFLRAKPGTETATARALDSAESTSYLKATVMAFQDSVEKVLWHLASWSKLDTGGTVQINGDFTLEEANPTELDALDKARGRKDISRPAHLAELKRRKVLCDDFDEAKDKELIDEEAEDLATLFKEQQASVPPGNKAPLEEED